MDDREELEMLRRLAALEDRERAAGGASAYPRNPEQVRREQQASQYGGGDPNVYEASVFKRALGGAKHAWDSAAMGLKQLMPEGVQRAADWVDERLPGHTPLTKEQIEQGRSFVNVAGAPGKVGQVAGDMAITGPIFGAAGEGINAVGQAVQALPRAVAATGRMIANPWARTAEAGAVSNAVVAPENKGKAAVAGAAGGVIGQGIGTGLARAVGGPVGAAVTPEAREMINEGVQVPLWRATPNRVVRYTAETARALPVTRQIINSQEEAARVGYNQGLVRAASPRVPELDEAGGVRRWVDQPVQDVGQAGLRQLHENYRRAYEALYSGRRVPLDDQYRTEMQRIVDETRRYYPSIAADVEGAARQATDTMMPWERAAANAAAPAAPPPSSLGSGPVSSRIRVQQPAPPPPPLTQAQQPHAGVEPNAMASALDRLESDITAAWRSGDGTRATQLQAIHDTISAARERGLPPEVNSMVAEINARYQQYKTLQRAAGMSAAQREGGVVTPAHVLNSIKARDTSPGKSRWAEGTAPGQQAAQRAQRVLGDELPTVGPGTAEKTLPLLLVGSLAAGNYAPLAYTGALAGLATRQGQRYMAGGYPWQRYGRDYGPTIERALRLYGATTPQRE